MRTAKTRTGTRALAAGGAALAGFMALVSVAWACAPLLAPGNDLHVVLEEGQSTAPSAPNHYDPFNYLTSSAEDANGLTGPWNVANKDLDLKFLLEGYARIPFNVGISPNTWDSDIWMANTAGGNVYTGSITTSWCKADTAVATKLMAASGGAARVTVTASSPAQVTTTPWMVNFINRQDPAVLAGSDPRPGGGLKYLVCVDQTSGPSYPNYFKSFITMV